MRGSGYGYALSADSTGGFALLCSSLIHPRSGGLR